MSWNPNDKNAAISLFETGNVLARATNTAWKMVRGENPKSSGKWYYEVHITTAASNYNIVGVATSAATLNNYVGYDAGGYGYYGISGVKVHNAAQNSYGPAYGANDVIGVILDLDSGTLEFSKNGTRLGTAFTGLSGTFHPAFSPYSNTSDGRGHFTASTVVYEVPLGFTPWDDNPQTQYTIEASAGANGSISPSGSVTVDYGNDQAFDMFPDEGYKVDDVLVDGDSVGAVASYTFETVVDDHTIAVSFTLLSTVTITASAGQHGSIDPAGEVEVTELDDQLFTAISDEGYLVGALIVDGVDQGPISSYTFENVIEDHAISAHFARDTRILDHLAGGTTTTCEIWKVTRADSTILGFTTHDRDLVYRGVTYHSGRGGFFATAISKSADFGATNLEVQGVVDVDAITREDLLARKYDGARLQIGLINYMDLSISPLILAAGTLGEVKYENGKFQVEVLGLGKGLQQTVGDTIEKDCQARFGDSRCKIDASLWTVSGTVTTPDPDEPRRKFWDSSISGDDHWFMYGHLTWLTGANAGISVEVTDSNEHGRFELFEVMPHEIQNGDTFDVVAGCDGQEATCRTKWGSSNIVNFRGYGLFLPGRSGLLDYPDRT